MDNFHQFSTAILKIIKTPEGAGKRNASTWINQLNSQNIRD
jgi:hypothetical protein